MIHTYSYIYLFCIHVIIHYFSHFLSPCISLCMFSHVFIMVTFSSPFSYFLHIVFPCLILYCTQFTCERAWTCRSDHVRTFAHLPRVVHIFLCFAALLSDSYEVHVRTGFLFYPSVDLISTTFHTHSILSHAYSHLYVLASAVLFGMSIFRSTF
jgi:hypothetical protein